MKKNQVYLGWVLRLVAAIILLQTLYFKFSAHPESVILFTKLGVEPWGRIATGLIELITAAMLLWRPTVWFGAIMGMGLMAGAIASHLFVIGVESAGDGGQLFILAFVVLFACVFIAFLFRKDILKFKFIPAFIKNSIAA
jgi:putative oxidoreductase